MSHPVAGRVSMAASNKGECLPSLAGFPGSSGRPWWGGCCHMWGLHWLFVCGWVYLNVSTNYINNCTSVYIRS